jgi:hypothetical protein
VGVRVYIYIYIYIYTYIHIYIYIHIHIHIHIHLHMYVFMRLTRKAHVWLIHLFARASITHIQTRNTYIPPHIACIHKQIRKHVWSRPPKYPQENTQTVLCVFFCISVRKNTVHTSGSATALSDVLLCMGYTATFHMFVCMCVCVCVFVCLCAHIVIVGSVTKIAYLAECISLDFTQVDMHVWIYAHIWIYVPTCSNMYIYIYIYIYIYMTYTYINACTYAYIHPHTYMQSTRR